MTKRTKRDRLSKWDDGENPLNDDQDDYISERSSILSLEGHFRGPDGATKQQQQQQQQQQQSQPYPQGDQQQYQDPYLNGEGPHTLRYFYNELPEHGVPAATIAKESKKETKRRIKEEREAKRGQGQLVEGPGAKPLMPGEMHDNYYPYWYYYKAKNPDWIMRQQQYSNAPFLPAPEPTTKIDLTEPENLPVEPKLTLAQRKARKYQYGDRDTPDIKYNRMRRRYEMLGKDGKPIDGDENNDRQETSSRQYVPLKDGDNEDDPRLRKNGRYSRSDSRGKLQTEYDWAEHYTNYMRNKSALGNHSVNYKPNIRSKHRRSRKDYDPLRGIYGDDDDENGPNGGQKDQYYTSRGRNYSPNAAYNRNNRYTTRSQQDYTTSTNRYGQQGYNQSQPRSNQNYSAPHGDRNGRNGNNYHHSHSHSYSNGNGYGRDQNGNQRNNHYISSKDMTGTGFRVTDASGRTGNGNALVQEYSRGRGPPSIYNQSSFLPPISRDYLDRPHPMDYYGTQALTNDWKTLSYAPLVYKSNARTKFYDRYLSNVIDKRLFT
ncbi:unnamed protein product [Adineta ricciae]|uniref:Uncharacterized protein n=1 Tax=Adineta ricciae TaxID=249248 RepID=A0A813XPM8_ADIRI|nr:unnamed protein product [Adineta ricciae]